MPIRPRQRSRQTPRRSGQIIMIGHRIGARSDQLAADLRQHHRVELQPLGLVHRHHADHRRPRPSDFFDPHQLDEIADPRHRVPPMINRQNHQLPHPQRIMRPGDRSQPVGQLPQRHDQPHVGDHPPNPRCRPTLIGRDRRLRQMKRPSPVPRVLGHHQRRQQHLHRRRIGQRIAALLRYVHPRGPQPPDHLTHRRVGPRQNTDRFWSTNPTVDIGRYRLAHRHDPPRCRVENRRGPFRRSPLDLGRRAKFKPSRQIRPSGLMPGETRRERFDGHRLVMIGRGRMRVRVGDFVPRQIPKHIVDHLGDDRAAAVTQILGPLIQPRDLIRHGIKNLRHAAPPTIDRLLGIADAKKRSVDSFGFVVVSIDVVMPNIAGMRRHRTQHRPLHRRGVLKFIQQQMVHRAVHAAFQQHRIDRRQPAGQPHRNVVKRQHRRLAFDRLDCRGVHRQHPPGRFVLTDQLTHRHRLGQTIQRVESRPRLRRERFAVENRHLVTVCQTDLRHQPVADQFVLHPIGKQIGQRCQFRFVPLHLGRFGCPPQTVGHRVPNVIPVDRRFRWS